VARPWSKSVAQLSSKSAAQPLSTSVARLSSKSVAQPWSKFPVRPGLWAQD
jgi:hypothetical protein